MLACDPTAAVDASTTNTSFVDKWNRAKQFKVVEMYGRMYRDLFNVPQLMLQSEQPQNKFVKSAGKCYLLASKEDTTATFEFLHYT